MFHYWTLPRRFVPVLDTLLTTLKPFGGCFGTHSLILRTHEFQVSHVTENCLCFTIGRFHVVLCLQNCLCFTIGRFHVVLCLHLTHFWPLLSQWGAVLGHILDGLGRPWALRDAPKLVLGDTGVRKSRR